MCSLMLAGENSELGSMDFTWLWLICSEARIAAETVPVTMLTCRLAETSYGQFSMPSTEELFCFKAADTVISAAPPQRTSFGWFIMFLATDIASCRFLSTSIKRSLLAPRNNTVQALGDFY
ncbi:hypothetical protein KIW84_061486 [Lathyrus oleraceus]|uniref:Uncharacterized protein n=1 Tax=Pisum sativum TaxID=3888 RepID=A0A9D4W567_PEA|nr:hypothetical protein KIW84_061486 [Pisum sativum]